MSCIYGMDSLLLPIGSEVVIVLYGSCSYTYSYLKPLKIPVNCEL